MRWKPEEINALTPVQVATYVRGRGWSRTGEIEGKATLWTKEFQGDFVELVVPQSASVGDYPLRIAEALDIIARVDDRSTAEVYEDITMATDDVVRLRFVGPHLEDGSISIEHGAKLMGAAQSLIVAAACSAAAPRPVFGPRRSAAVDGYLDTVRFAPSRRGSFVVTVRSPVSPTLVATQPTLFTPIDEESEPLDRRVVSVLATALDATKSAAAAAGIHNSLVPFEQSIARGVSANLCEAVSVLLIESGARELDITFSWAPGRSSPPSAPNRVKLSPDIVPFAREAARQFRARAPQPSFELVGLVYGCERKEGAPTGTITIPVVVDGAARKVRVELPLEQYNLAVEAHKADFEVRCFGTLEKAGRSLVLKDPQGFEVLS